MDYSDSAAAEEPAKTTWAQSGRAVLRRGWWLGKNVAIAGAAITSAPVVIPSLLIVSTLGVAFSLPFGVYYASFVGTEKVMRTLLPLRLDTHVDDHELVYGVTDDDVEEGGQEGRDGDGEEGDFELSYHPSLAMEELQPSITVGDEIDEPMENEGEDAQEDIEVEGTQEKDQADSHQDHGDRETIHGGEEKLESGIETSSEQASEPKATFAAVVARHSEENEKDQEPDRTVTIQEPPATLIKSKEPREAEITGEKRNEVSIPIQEKGKEVEGTEKLEEGSVHEPTGVKQDAKEEGFGMRGEEELVPEQKQVEAKTDEEKAPAGSELGNSPYMSASEDLNEGKSDGERSEYASAFEDPASDVGETDSTRSRGSVDHGLETRSGGKVVSLNREAALSSDDEVSYTAQKLWEQVVGIRAIVGYKAVLCPSLVAELRALYLFTGVEPPVSFSDNSDLAEVSSNLQFLKSVIGVK